VFIAIEAYKNQRYAGGMEVLFANETLGLVETEDAGKTRLPVAVIKSARRKLTILRAAPDDRSLRNWKSLHYERLKGNREGQRSIRLNDQYRMVLTIDEETNPPTATVIAIEDYH
jgi:proteic killer suppression protein